MKTFIQFIALIILADVMGFIMWTSLGQHPRDNFYLGTLTAHTINLFK